MTTSMTADTGETLEIYVHTDGSEELLLVSVARDGCVRDLLTDGDTADDQMLWLVDGDEPLDAGRPVRDAGLTHRCHVHRGRCRSVTVHVHYNGAEIERAVPPGLRVARVYGWAAGPEGFDLPRDQIPGHALGIRGREDFPDAETHVGSLVVDGCCEVDFDLVARRRYAG